MPRKVTISARQYLAREIRSFDEMALRVRALLSFIGEVGREQRLLEILLPSMQASPVQQTVSIEGVVDAASYGNMIPMFVLGIPGSGTTAVLMGGMLMIDLQPGPVLFATQQDFVWTIFGNFYIGNLALVVITLAMIPLLASCALVRPGYL